MTREKPRCSWASSSDEMIAYHDREWGRPVHDDQVLFEMLILEGAQAGLSWAAILKRREGYRKAFRNFDVRKVAAMKDGQLEKLMQDGGIIRNRLKIFGTRKNARAFIAIQKEFGSFDQYLWRFVGGKTIRNKVIPGHYATRSAESDALSRDLKKRGMSFVGTTIVYAYMQAIGMVDDHMAQCFKRKK